MTAYLLTFGCIFALNLLPAFGPPTWALLVFFTLQYDLPIVPMVVGGAVCAASGRLALAHGSRRFRHRLSAERREHLNAAAQVLAADRRRSAGALGLFALSPVPSAQLFVAAGLLDLRLFRLTAAFFAGRVVSYTIYVSGATVAHDSLEDVLGRAFASPVGIALQLAMLVGLIALLRIDWTSRLARYRPDVPSTGRVTASTCDHARVGPRLRDARRPPRPARRRGRSMSGSR
jgi:hypothetical protein